MRYLYWEYASFFIAEAGIITKATEKSPTPRLLAEGVPVAVIVAAPTAAVGAPLLLLGLGGGPPGS
jgi:hypothetical protein